MSDMPSEPLETQQLLERINIGDGAAVEELFAIHRSFLRRLVQSRMDPRLRQRVDPSDIVQEAQLEASRRLATYAQNRPMGFRLWLRQIAYDRLIMLQRKHVQAKRRTVTRDTYGQDYSSIQLAQCLVSEDPTPSQCLVRNELKHRVHRAVSNLRPLDREIILMRSFEGLSNREVAILIEIDPSSASRRYGRALLRLRTLLMDLEAQERK